MESDAIKVVGGSFVRFSFPNQMFLSGGRIYPWYFCVEGMSFAETVKLIIVAHPCYLADRVSQVQVTSMSKSPV